MKSEVMPSIVQLEPEALKNLVQEVKETIATDFTFAQKNAKNKTFGAVDLWNMRRTVKTARNSFDWNF